MNELRILNLFWQQHFIIQDDVCSCLPFCIIPVNIVATIFRSYILNVLESKSVEIIQKHEATSILTFHYEILF